MQSLQQQEELFEAKTRVVRVPLAKWQIELLVEYAIRNGYQRKEPSHQWDITAKNQAAKWAILSRLGFDTEV